MEEKSKYMARMNDLIGEVPTSHLHEYVDEIAELLKERLVEDEGRWGGTWIRRGKDEQNERFIAWLDRKLEVWRDDPDCVDPLAIMGECLILIVREIYL